MLVASVRSPMHVVEAAKIGAHIATVPPAVLRQLFNHPLTDKGLGSVPGRLGQDGPADRLMSLREGEFVEAFLRANPAWLAEHPQLYHVLEPPARVHGEGLADHMAAMLRAQRANVDGLLAAGRASAGLAGRVQDAVLALLRCERSGGLREWRDAGHPGVDAAHLCAGGGPAGRSVAARRASWGGC